VAIFRRLYPFQCRRVGHVLSEGVLRQDEVTQRQQRAF